MGNKVVVETVEDCEFSEYASEDKDEGEVTEIVLDNEEDSSEEQKDFRDYLLARDRIRRDIVPPTRYAETRRDVVFPSLHAECDVLALFHLLLLR